MNMLAVGFLFDRPLALQILHTFCIIVAGGAPFALMVWHDARKRKLPVWAVRFFPLLTIPTGLLGVVLYMGYEIRYEAKARAVTGGERKGLKTWTLIAEMVLAVIVIVVYYLIFRTLLSSSWVTLWE